MGIEDLLNKDNLGKIEKVIKSEKVQEDAKKVADDVMKKDIDNLQKDVVTTGNDILDIIKEK